VSDAPVRFLFDYISHNAYLAWVELQPLARRCGRAVEPVPVLFAGLLNAHGQLGPAEVAPKARWMMLNVARKARLLGIPLGTLLARLHRGRKLFERDLWAYAVHHDLLRQNTPTSVAGEAL
jgi:2-hydroxychromene-2-carboxylate isomerase